MSWQTVAGVLVSCLMVVEAGYCRVNSCRGVGILYKGCTGLILHSGQLFTEVLVSCKEMILHSGQLFTGVLVSCREILQARYGMVSSCRDVGVLSKVIWA